MDPALEAVTAAVMPAGDAPTTSTSHFIALKSAELEMNLSLEKDASLEKEG
jgi:hypothetical protein